LQPLLAYQACFLATDTDGNTQAETTSLAFRTADSSPPLLSLRVRAETLAHGLSNTSCSFLAEVRLSESGSAVVQVLPKVASMDHRAFSPADLYGDSLEVAAEVPILASRELMVGPSQIGMFAGASLNGLPCDATLQVWLTALSSAQHVPQGPAAVALQRVMSREATVRMFCSNMLCSRRGLRM